MMCSCGSGILLNNATGISLAMLLQISFLTIRHRERQREDESLQAIEYVPFVRLRCLEASICFSCLGPSSHFFVFFLLHVHQKMDKSKQQKRKLAFRSLSVGNSQSSISLACYFSTTASNLQAVFDPLCFSLPLLVPSRHIGLIDVCACM